jgi:hypothetical protein
MKIMLSIFSSIFYYLTALTSTTYSMGIFDGGGNHSGNSAPEIDFTSATGMMLLLVGMIMIITHWNKKA